VTSKREIIQHNNSNKFEQQLATRKIAIAIIDVLYISKLTIFSKRKKEKWYKSS